MRLLSNSTVADAARKLGGSEEMLDGLLDRWIERAVAWDTWARLGVLGLDEMALKRRPRAFGVVVTVPLEGGGVEIRAGRAARTKETVVAFLRAMPETRRRTIAGACPERSEGFGRALAEEVPWAEIVIDRFPGARADRACADTVRKQELKRLKSAMPNAEDAELKGALGPSRNRPGDRKPQDWQLLERVCTRSPKLEAAYHLREALTTLFERGDTKAGATCAIRAWCQRGRASGLAAFEGVLGTIDRWRDASTTDFQGRQPSGVVEGCTNRVKVLKRRGYGSFAVGKLVQRRRLAWQGSQLFGHT